MKTNRPIDERSYKKWKRIIESNEAEEAESKDIDRYFEDVKKSQGFEVGYYPHINPKRTGFCSRFTRIYDSSHTRENLIDDRLLCYSNLAICFYNMREDTCFDHVKLIMATQSGVKRENFHITFEAFSSTSTGERVAVTFQTQIFEPHPSKPYRRFEIIFVRIKPESQNSQQDHPSEFDDDHKAQIYQHRLHQVIETYTIDSQLDSQYSLALYLSQYALVCYNLFRLKGLVAKHDIKLLEVVELMKHVAEETTYHITFKAPLRAKSVRSKSVRKKFFTFKAEICMPILFPTTSILLKSGPEVITEDYIPPPPKKKKAKKDSVDAEATAELEQQQQQEKMTGEDEMMDALSNSMATPSTANHTTPDQGGMGTTQGTKPIKGGRGRPPKKAP